MDSYTADIHKIEECLNKLKGKEYISESTVDFFRDIIRAQYRVKNQLNKVDISYSYTDDEIKQKMQKGKPLISWDNLPLKEPHLKELFLEICKIMKGQENVESGEIQRLINAESCGDLTLNNLIKNLFYHDRRYFHSLSDDLEVSEELLLFVALHLAKPFFESVAERLKGKVADNRWLKNCCPVCGSGAQMAKLHKEDGRRVLYCLLCGSEWRFMRIKCPFCCNEKQESLKFLGEEKSPYRIDLCEQCRRYIKTLDERKAGDE